MAPSTRERIIEEVVPKIREDIATQYADSALKENEAQWSHLQEQLRAYKEDLNKASMIVKSKSEAHGAQKRLQESHMRRLAYKVGGKREEVDEGANRVLESEWMDAIEAKKSIERDISQCEHAAGVLSENIWFLRDVKRRNEITKRQFVDAYEHIFSKPTPDFPEADEKTRLMAEAQSEICARERQMKAEKEVLEILGHAGDPISEALDLIASASDRTTTNKYLSESVMLTNAQMKISRGLVLIEEARCIRPAIPSIGHSAVSDLKDTSLKEQTVELLEKAKGILGEEWERQELRVKAVEKTLSDAKATFNKRKEELQNLRKRIVMQVAGIDETA
ncbi:hypothetical protein HYFRA_00010858 [Hymenoscyphus fraxineus]|uniref:Uncharacterized protein n=1 Tax=Hymenoscyphus fraxineus TaxID=746836 RepID=A0A9N9KXQ0_9HELO|nr:hypothetical protein HYFRA_00010858 [Hymenoscyphus fraxineus]